MEVSTLHQRQKNSSMLAMAASVFAFTILSFQAELNVLLLGDLHLDPLYSSQASPSSFCREFDNSFPNAPFSQLKCDISQSFLDGTLEFIAESVVDERFSGILLLGDLAAHKLPDSVLNYATVAKAKHSLDSTLVQKFKRLHKSFFAAFTLGNNDVSPGYGFGPTVHDSQILKLAELFSDEIWLSKSTNEAKEFSSAGFYAKNVPWLNLRVLSLNSIYYVPHYKFLKDLDSQTDPFGQFEWLEAQLEEAATQCTNVIIITHVPLGVNGYTSQPSTSNQYTRRLTSLIAAYNDIVVTILSGHYHQDIPAAIFDDLLPAVPVFANPSISPSNGNYPGFRYLVLDYNETSGSLRLKDIVQYYTNINEQNRLCDASLASGEGPCKVHYTRQYSFRELYSPWLGRNASLTAANIWALYGLMRSDAFLWQLWLSHSTMLAVERRKEQICASFVNTVADYEECLLHTKF